MFWEWVSAGAIFGIEAFACIFTFLLFCAAGVGILALIGSFFKAGSGEDGMDRM